VNIPVEIVAVAFAAILATLGWVGRKLMKLETTVALIAQRLGIVEEKYEADEIVRPRVSGRPALGRVQHDPTDGRL
jgi:hypothetical protein